MPFVDRNAAIPGVVAVWSVGLLLTACTVAPQQPTPVPPTAAPIVFATTAPTTAPSTAAPPSPSPTAPPSPIAAPATPVVPSRLYVTGTGAQGLTMRRAPGGEPEGVLPDGTPLMPTGELQQVDGRRWIKVTDAQGREGWVAAEFLTPNAPASAAATSPALVVPITAPGSAAGTTPTPFTTRVVTPIPRVTPTPAVVVPAAPPAIFAPATPKPQAPAAAPKPSPAAP